MIRQTDQHECRAIHGGLLCAWGVSQVIQKLKPDGSVIEFQATLSGLEEITRWVLSWGSKAKVLGPPELVKRVREEIEKMAGMN
jgi:predicted DNA-binding transcriptional regulator YafY